MSDHQTDEQFEIDNTGSGVVDPESAPILEDDGRTVVPPALSTTGGRGRFVPRLLGLVAALLGLVGAVASLAAGLAVLQLGLATTDTADGLIEPISVSVDRLETRVDQVDDLVGRQGVDPDDVEQLIARADGLGDLVDGARRSYDAIDGHPVYRWLPLELDGLDSTLTRVETATETIVDGAASASTGSGRVPDAQAETMSEQINDLQGRFGEFRSAVESARDSLTRWIRLVTFGGFVLALWSLWAQMWLLRRGWRGLLGRTL